MKIKHRPLLVSVTALVALALSSCAAPETDRDLFLQADTNKDGKLSLDEVNRVGLPRLFGRFDLNGDGSVTLAEVRQVEPAFKEADFAERDLDQDGKVSYAESEKVALSKGGLKRYFAAVDTNGDGVVDKREADAYVDRQERGDAQN